MLSAGPAMAGVAAGRSEKPLKAAFSNAGLQATWCAQGKSAAEYWGKLYNVEVTWFDGQLDAVKQRAAVDNMASLMPRTPSVATAPPTDATVRKSRLPLFNVSVITSSLVNRSIAGID